MKFPLLLRLLISGAGGTRAHMVYHIPASKVSFVHVICHSPCLTVRRKLYSAQNETVTANYYCRVKI
jgi:hypothetical protein